MTLCAAEEAVKDSKLDFSNSRIQYKTVNSISYYYY